jgi:uncharacterized membrane protein YeaQ/YmgE (transglycosylase-associated protein family)
VTILAWILIGILLGLIARVAMPVPHDGGVLPPIIVGLSSAIAGGALATIFFYGELIKLNHYSVIWSVIASMYVLFTSRCLAMRASGHRTRSDDRGRRS